MIPRISTRLVLTLLAAGAAACSDTTAPPGAVTESMLTRDVANDAADATAQDLAQMGGFELLMGMPLAAPAMKPTSAFGNCAFDAATSFFNCPSISTPDGLTLSRYLEIFGGGTAQRSYDPIATDSILFHGSLSGTLARSDRTAWLNHSRYMMLTGLGGTETQRNWRGIGSRDDSAHVNTDNVVRTTRFVSTDAIDNVVYKLPRADFPFPQSGTITSDMTVSSTTPDGTEATNRRGTRHVVVTFNGTRTASVVVGTTACSLDLVTRKLTCP